MKSGAFVMSLKSGWIRAFVFLGRCTISNLSDKLDKLTGCPGANWTKANFKLAFKKNCSHPIFLLDLQNTGNGFFVHPLKTPWTFGNIYLKWFHLTIPSSISTKEHSWSVFWHLISRCRLFTYWNVLSGITFQLSSISSTLKSCSGRHSQGCYWPYNESL